jgi:hypothetical protein
LNPWKKRWARPRSPNQMTKRFLWAANSVIQTVRNF